jgi:hypothetical protein
LHILGYISTIDIPSDAEAREEARRTAEASALFGTFNR